MAIDWSGMLGAIGPGLGNLFGQGMGMMQDDNWQNPANAAMPYMEKIPGQMKQQYNPYIQAGKKALPTMNQQYSQLLNDPGAAMNKIGQSYQQSPGLDFAIQKALEAGKHAMAAGGMAGSPMHEYYSMQSATGLANQDFNNWLSNALNMYGRGLSGEENLYGTGANASNNLAQMIAQSMAKQGELAYKGAAEQNEHEANMQKNKGGFFDTLGSIASTALPFFF